METPHLLFFNLHPWHVKFPSQGSNLRHSIDLSHSSDDTRSLTCWATRELLKLHFLQIAIGMVEHLKMLSLSSLSMSLVHFPSGFSSFLLICKCSMCVRDKSSLSLPPPAIPVACGSSWARDWTCAIAVPSCCNNAGFLTCYATMELHILAF